MKLAGKWKRMLATGLAASALFAGSALAAENRMEAAKAAASRRTATEGPRVVGFKSERTDSWLCLYVNPFFCSSIPTASATPQPGTTSTRGRGRP